MASTGPDPVLALRTATQVLHTQLDSQLPIAQPVTDVADGLARYRQHLQVLGGWLQAMAPLLQRAGWGQDHLATVQADLADLPPTPAQADAAAAGPLPAPQPDPAFAWGVAYVVEGSQLGGRVLLRGMRQAGLTHPLRYLEGRGPHTGAHWNGFLQALRAALATPADIASASRGACWAFEGLLARFRHLGLVK